MATLSPVPNAVIAEQRWRAYAVLAVSVFMTIVDLAITNVALPTIDRWAVDPSTMRLPTGTGDLAGTGLVTGAEPQSAAARQAASRERAPLVNH